MLIALVTFILIVMVFSCPATYILNEFAPET